MLLRVACALGSENGKSSTAIATDATQHPRKAALSAAAAGLDLRPGVAEGDRPIEHRRARRRVGVDAEVALPFELETVAWRGGGEARFELRVGESDERLGVELLEPLAFLAGVGVFGREETVVE